MTSRDISEHLLSPLVEVSVGEGETKKVYQLHLSLLCEVSAYCRGSLTTSFAEASSRKVVLPDMDPAAFAWFVRWVYNGEIGPFGTEGIHSIMEKLIDLYLIGDRLLCPGLQNRTMDMMQDACTEDYTSVDTLVKVGCSVPTGSKMAEYMVQQLAYDMAIGGWMKNYTDDDKRPGFLTANGRLTSQLLIEMMRLKTPEVRKSRPANPHDLEGCRWHEHEGNEDLECKRWPLHIRDIYWAFGF